MCIRDRFTLVEMVVVIGILGILSGLGFMKFGEVQKSAKLNSDYVAASSIATATNLALQDGNIDGKSDVTTDILMNKGYLSSKPKPQSSDEEFLIKIQKDNIIVEIGTKQFYPKVVEEDKSQTPSEDEQK